jgi:hypothetical protein
VTTPVHYRFVLRSRLCIALFLLALTGCGARAFELTDRSAMDRLMATKHVAALRGRIAAPLTCRVEGVEPDARRLYLGESHDTHTVRVGAYRVTADGRAWRNADPTLLEERWTAIE